MSTRIGTLQAPKTARSIWPAAIIASLVMLSIGLATYYVGRDQGTQTPKTVVGGAQQTVVHGTAANTPTEINGGVVGGVATSQASITAGSSSLAVAATPDVIAAIIAARNAADQTFIDTTVRDEPIMVNGHICGQCG
jgi:hypothetical protein